MVSRALVGAIFLFFAIGWSNGKPLEFIDESDELSLENVVVPEDITDNDGLKIGLRKDRQFGFGRIGYGGYGGYGGGYGGFGGGYGGYGHGGGGYGGYHGHSHYAPSYGHGGYGHQGYGHGGYGHGGFGGYDHHHHHHGFGRGFGPELPGPDFDPQRFYADPFFAYADAPIPIGPEPINPIFPHNEAQIPVSVIGENPENRPPPHLIPAKPKDEVKDKEASADKKQVLSKDDTPAEEINNSEESKPDKKECTCKDDVKKSEKSFEDKINS
ncbi:uncharacterized protein LOC143913883 [Arctopsyche grandis]|uniref:uncharacterized protein LOC143913883 n=1 Tax=Arctopsyche grandis TaxID=121162 RepID=UPI00406D9CA8